jgi:hypothetical protein
LWFYPDPAIVNQLLHMPRDASPLDALTEGERGVLDAMADGDSNGALVGPVLERPL